MNRIKQIAAGLYQGALRHVAEDGLLLDVDVVFLMAPEAERIWLPAGRAVTFIYLPIDDNPDGIPSKQLDKLREAARSVPRSTKLTICHMGENRSGLMSALLLYELYGYSTDAAIQAVQMHGPINSANAPHALWNPGFQRQLRELP